jgi:hypothetical protein
MERSKRFRHTRRCRLVIVEKALVRGEVDPLNTHLRAIARKLGCPARQAAGAAAEIECLSKADSDQKTGRGSRGNPALTADAVRADGPREAREREHAGRALHGFETAHDLDLLGGKPLARKRRIRFLPGIVTEPVEPGRQSRET